MAFDPQDYLPLVDSLLRAPTASAEYRTARGRAYYAAYLVGRDRLAAIGVEQHKSDRLSAHQWLVDKLRTAKTAPHIQKLGERLEWMKIRRGWADYELDHEKELTQGECLGFKTRAQRWIEDLERISLADLKRAIRPE